MKSVETFWDRQAGHFTEDLETVDLARNKDYNTLLNCLTPESIVMDFGCATGIVSNAIAEKSGKSMVSMFLPGWSILPSVLPGKRPWECPLFNGHVIRCCLPESIIRCNLRV